MRTAPPPLAGGAGQEADRTAERAVPASLAIAGSPSDRGRCSASPRHRTGDRASGHLGRRPDRPAGSAPEPRPARGASSRDAGSARRRPARVAIQAALWRASVLAAVTLLALAASSLLAGHSLAVHVRVVADGLTASGVAGGRVGVARIVGRDPVRLDAAGVAGAAIESLAENFSDVWWPRPLVALLGLPGSCSTRRSTPPMHDGHRDAAARGVRLGGGALDELDLPWSRLSALLLAGAALLRRADAHAAWSATFRDASLCRESPGNRLEHDREAGNPRSVRSPRVSRL